MKAGQTYKDPTRSGLNFEKSTSLEEALISVNFKVDGFKVYEPGGALVGELAPKNQLYKFLEERDVYWKDRISKRLLPDEALFSKRHNRLNIIEKKWQEVEGSVDEKLQTVGFKIRQYDRLVAGTGIEIKFIYLLNDWFTKPSYADVLEYIVESGASYHFLSVPLEELEL